VDQNGPVLFDHQQSGRFRQERVQTAGVSDFAAGNDQAHRANLPSLSDRPGQDPGPSPRCIQVARTPNALAPVLFRVDRW